MEENDRPDLERTAHPSQPSETLERLEALMPRGSRYTLEREVARGGMGAILRVWDPELRRDLAMKVLLAGNEAQPRAATEADDRTLSRFLEEAQVTGQLDHPGIVPVHELGLDPKGRLYFTMRLVRGRNLEQIFQLARKESDGWTRTRVLEVLLKVCEAMAYAHSKGVVHRDLKPANVMAGRFGEVYVMDWGLARVLGREDRHGLRLREESLHKSLDIRTDRDGERQRDQSSPLITMDGDVVGTPAFMAPEQARGDLQLVDRRTDVYAVGAMLYQFLSGSAPYMDTSGGLSNLSVWTAVKGGPPSPLAELAPKAPPELVAICEKAMKRDPLARYADMKELEADLRSFLEGRVVHAYETGAVAELRKWVRRNKATAAATAAALLLAIGGLAATSWIQVRAKNDLQVKNELLAETSEDLRVARDEAVANAGLALERKREADAAAAEAIANELEATRARDASERVTRFLVDMFESSEPRIARGSDVTVKSILARGAEELDTLDEDPLVAARLRDAMGAAYLALGLYDAAEPLLVRARADRLKDSGPDDPDTLASFDRLGFLRYHQARYAEAQELLQAALAGRERAHGPAAAEVQETRLHLALVHRKEGRYERAAALLRDALAALRALHGDEHEDTLDAKNNLGGVLFLQKRLADAEPLLQEAYAGRARLLGEDHPDTLISENDLAMLLSALGKRELAREHLERCLDELSRVMDEEHPFTLTVMNNLAGLLLEVRDYAGAEGLFRDALELSRRVLSDTHPNTIGTLNGLGQVLYATGRKQDAVLLFEEALEGLQAKFEQDHPNTLVLLETLITVHRDLGNTEDALRHARALLAATPASDAEYARRGALVEQLERER